MKAILMRRTGGPEVLEPVELPAPRPGPGEVLVRAHAIGVNRPEILVRKGLYRWMPELPAIPGIEMSGTVAERGEGVDAALLGRPVYVSARDLAERAGCYAAFIAVPAAAIHPLPEGCDLDAAACLSSYDVAWHCLHMAARGAAGGTVLVTGATGAIGGAAVQLAGAAGRRVVAVARSEAGAAALRDGGADAIVTAGPDLPAQLRALTGGSGVDLVLDFVGGPGFSQYVALLAPLGLAVSCGRVAGPPGGDLAGALVRHIEASPAVRIFSMHVLDGRPDLRRAAMRELAAMLGDGRIRPKIAGVFPLAEAGAAQTALEDRSLGPGKILLRP
jgi:NADPH2:quinone reductase